MAKTHDVLINQDGYSLEWDGAITHPAYYGMSGEIIDKNTVTAYVTGGTVLSAGQPVSIDANGYLIPFLKEDSTLSTATSGVTGAATTAGAMAYGSDSDRFLIEYGILSGSTRYGTYQTVKIVNGAPIYGNTATWYEDTALYNVKDLRYISAWDRYLSCWSWAAFRYINLVSVTPSGFYPIDDAIEMGGNHLIYELYGNRDVVYDPISDCLIEVMGKETQGRIKLFSHSDITLTLEDEIQFITSEASYLRAEIDDNTGKFVILYYDGTSETYSQFGYIDGVPSIQMTGLNVETDIGTNIIYTTHYCSVNNILILIYGATTTDNPYCKVGTVDWENETITWGTETLVTSAYNAGYIEHKERIHYDENTRLYNFFWLIGNSTYFSSGQYNHDTQTMVWSAPETIYSSVAEINSFAYDSTNKVYLTQNWLNVQDQAYLNVLDINGLTDRPFVGIIEVPYYVNEDTEIDLLIHSNATSGSATFEDSSHNNLTITPVGSIIHSSEQAKFWGTSFESHGGYLESDSIYFNPNADFTIGFWIYWTGTVNEWIFGHGYGATYVATQVTIRASCWSGTIMVVGIHIGSSNGVLYIGSLAAGWNHVAIIGYGDYIYGYRNGVQTGSPWDRSAYAPTNGINNFSANWRVCGYANQQPFDSGYLEEFYVSRRAEWIPPDSFSTPTRPYVNYHKVGTVTHTTKSMTGLTIPSKYYLDVNGNLGKIGDYLVGSSVTDTNLIIKA